MIGRTLAHYKILDKLGSGGMGDVYLADDTKLDRKVALKVLPPRLAEIEERRGRFEREAKAIAALDHPNIVQVFSVEEAEGVHFITMQLVKGKTLTQLMPRDGFPLSELVDVAIPMTDAVAAAHREGITHRDLKPDNVMVSEDGRVKVLDFGLAKPAPGLAGVEGASELETVEKTERGVIVGTVSYMSPEQAQGKSVDVRSDVFSLGIVLYEMATGERPFHGEGATAVLASILRDTPPSVTEVDPSLPPALDRIVERCLAKEPDRRYQTAMDLRNELEALKGGASSGIRSSPEAPRRRRFAMVAGALAAAAAALYLLWQPATRAPSLEPRFRQLTSQWGREFHPSISPDGKWIAYVSDASGNEDIYLESVEGENAINLTEGSPAGDREPAFSPDGQHIAFRSDRGEGGVFVMGTTGESPRLLAENAFDPAWSPDGTEVVFSTRRFEPNLMVMSPGELWAVDVTSGDKERLFEGDAAQPHWSPGGRRVAFCARVEKGGGWVIQTLAAGTGDGTEALPLTDGSARDWNPVWAPDGEHLYFISDRGGSMNPWRLPVDEASGEALGEPEPLSAPSPYVSHFSLSADGKRIAFANRDRGTNLQQVSFDSESAAARGEPTWLTRGSHEVGSFGVSSDWVAYRAPGGGLALVRLDGTKRRQLTTFASSVPSWSADGLWVAFVSPRSGRRDIWRIRVDSTGLEQLTDAARDGVSGYVHGLHSPDGSRMAVHTAGMRDGSAFLIDLAHQPAKPEALPPLTTGGAYFDPWSWSPDGKTLAGCAIDAIFRKSHYGIVLYSLEDRTYQKITDFGEAPAWLNDGRRLIFSSEGKLYVVDSVTRETRLALALPPPATMRWPQPSPDGNHVVYLRSIDESDVWLAELR